MHYVMLYGTYKMATVAINSVKSFFTLCIVNHAHMQTQDVVTTLYFLRLTKLSPSNLSDDKFFNK